MFKDKKVLIVGMARSGVSAAKVLVDLGAQVTINDSKTADQLGETVNPVLNIVANIDLGGPPQGVDQYDLMVMSPGVPVELPFVVEAKRAGVEVIGEVELAYQLSQGTWLGITGTNGKTTTTALTGAMFAADQKSHFVVGNIGDPAVEKAQLASDQTTMVTELSSFQLETIHHFKTHVAGILNFTPDHLNRHKTMENYIAAKCRIFENQTDKDYLILNFDQDLTWSVGKQAKGQVIPFSRAHQLDRGVFIKEGQVVIADGNGLIPVCPVADINIKGPHNLENALAATAMAYYGGVSVEAIASALKTFKSIAHRTEPIGTVQGVLYINDSKGTNPDASIVALKAMDVPTVLIAGGMDKGSDFTELVQHFHDQIKRVLVIGETADQILETARQHGYDAIEKVTNMEQAVSRASQIAGEGWNVLLSPACASWDMYASYEVRGDHFRTCVEKLRG